ncbi:carbon-phosphorus lyase complex subunit PhnI [Pseudomonas aeruginosa]
MEEFVLVHCDNVEAGGFVSHLKLPHYVDFQSELALLKARRPGAIAPAGEARTLPTHAELAITLPTSTSKPSA